MTGRAWLRVGLVLLAAAQGVPALWAACWPHGFYTSFPTPSQAWLTLFPPYNEHLVRDFGLMALQLTAVLAGAAVRVGFRFVRAALLAALLFYLPHMVYHQLHVMAGSDVVVQFVSQIVPIVLVAVLLVVNERTRAG